jgi:hypothetical protein
VLFRSPALFPYRAAQYKRDSDALSGLIQEIEHHAHFPLTNDEKKCAFCPYRSYCNRGEKAGTGEEAELEAASADFSLNFEQIAEIEF